MSAPDGCPEARISADRARVYGALALLFGPPESEGVARLREGGLRELRGALQRLEGNPSLPGMVGELAEGLAAQDPSQLREDYVRTFEPSGGSLCPPNETAHTADTPQAALVRTFELADVAGFYRAFGVSVAEETERADHIRAELEFMHLLAVKETVALLEPGAGEHVAICREAARGFLEEHLGRWAERFASRLDEVATHPFYATAGRLLGGFVADDAARLRA